MQQHLPLENGTRESYVAAVRTLNAHFDGRFIVLDEPARLKPNAKVKVLAADADDADGLTSDFARLSEPAFRAIWDNPLDADYDRL